MPSFFKSRLPSLPDPPLASMRNGAIIRLINARTKNLKMFTETEGPPIPPYAILSHTWGDKETTFRELRFLDDSSWKASRGVRQLPGKPKINKTCEQALRDGIEWVWIDTCCINKEERYELVRALNRMFDWYKNATICYAYLNDVMGSSEKELARARWFTRGWTLQELIAPSRMKFYKADWTFFGDRSTMFPVLERITGIHPEVFKGRPLNHFSVAHRMSWASKRTTTQTEDIAYCLLGIFEVSLPLDYGEGEKAFVRLQEEIYRDSTDQSLFAWTPASFLPTTGRSPNLSVFARHPACFSSSVHIWERVDDRFAQSRPYCLTRQQGLRIDLLNRPYIPKHPAPKDFRFRLVLLDCLVQGSDRTTRPGFVVKQRISDDPSRWMRYEQGELLFFNAKDATGAKRSTLYLWAEPPLISLPRGAE